MSALLATPRSVALFVRSAMTPEVAGRRSADSHAAAKIQGRLADPIPSHIYAAQASRCNMPSWGSQIEVEASLAGSTPTPACWANTSCCLATLTCG